MKKKEEKLENLVSNLNISKYNASAAGAFGSNLHKIDITIKNQIKLNWSYSDS